MDDVSHRMKRALLIACVLASAGEAHAERLVTTGQVTFNLHGIASIAECGTGRIIEVGVMASALYFQFMKEYEQLSGNEKKPVLVEAEGSLTATSAGKLALESPRIGSLKAGVCGG
jgi:hypothetical protein